MNEFDFFGKPVPTFNIRGKHRVSTTIGGYVSTICMVLVLIYATIKFIDLYNRNNPVINENIIKNYYGNEDVINLYENGFRMAFAIEGYYDQKLKDDPEYVKLLARLWILDHGV